jgi:hypothetical protein
MDALSAPLFRSVLVAVLATASIGAVYSTRDDDSTTRRLSLHAHARSDATYLTAWDAGDVFVKFPDKKLTGVVFYNRAWVSDGCRWQGTETLTPISGDAFFYEYSETVLSCKPGAKPYKKTPRTGMVTVEQ